MTDLELVQSQLNVLQDRQESLMRIPRIKKYMAIVNKHVNEQHNRDMTVYEKRNVAQCLYNAIIDTGLKAGTKLFEATTEDNIAFLGIQLPVIAALLPSLALNELAVVQALDRRIGAVFYMDVRYGNDKGSVGSGDTMIGARTGHSETKSGRRYAMARVQDEVVGTGDGAYVLSLEYAGTGAIINRENVIFERISNLGDMDSEVRTTLGVSDASGTVTGDFVTGTVTANGGGTVTAAGLNSTDVIYITYDYQYDLVDSDCDCGAGGVPEVDVAVTQDTVEAIDFPLRARYSIGAQIDLMKAHGIDLESELVKYLGSEIKFTIDQVGLDMIDDAAINGATISGVARNPAAQVTDWDARPGIGEPWLWKKSEFKDRIEEGSNNIFEATKRGVASWIHCGNDVARVIRQLTDHGFKPRPGWTGAAPTGPMVIGDLDGRPVVQNPFKRRDQYTLGFRGPSYLYAGSECLQKAA